MSVFKKIIEDYLKSVKEGETPNVDDLDALIDAEVPKVVVPKETYLQVKKTADEERATHKTTLADLQAKVDAGSDTAKLLEEAQAKVTQYEADAKQAKADADFTELATKLGVNNPRIIKLALQGNGVDLTTTDPELLEVKINGLKEDKDLATFFNKEDDDNGAGAGATPNGSTPNGAAGFTVLDNGIKSNTPTDKDAVSAQMAAAFGLKQNTK